MKWRRCCLSRLNHHPERSQPLHLSDWMPDHYPFSSSFPCLTSWSLFRSKMTAVTKTHKHFQQGRKKAHTRIYTSYPLQKASLSPSWWACSHFSILHTIYTFLVYLNSYVPSCIITSNTLILVQQKSFAIWNVSNHCAFQGFLLEKQQDTWIVDYYSACYW